MTQMFSVIGTAAASSAASTAVPLAYPADSWDQMFNIWLGLAVVIYLIVALPMLYFLYRFRYQEGVNETASTKEYESHGLEVLWTIVPLIVVIYMAVQSLTLYSEMRNPPPESLVVKTTGMMWTWQFDYPSGKTSYAELTVPVGKPIKLELTSRDVIHAFHIPAAKTMEDAVPGRVTHLWFQFNETGEFPSFCREYCGTAHAYMQAKIKVVTPEEFDEWINAG